MKKFLLATACFASLSGAAVASDKTEPMVPVRQFMDGFNQGDWKATLAACAETTAIVDNFPPYEWHGAGACEKWGDALQAFIKANGMTDPKVVLMKPKHVDVTGDRAYVVVPTAFNFKVKGKPMKQAGQFTAALVKSGSGWQIAGWAWADQ